MDMCSSLFMGYGPLLKAVRINPFVLLTAQLLDNLVNFMAAFAVILIGLLVFRYNGARLPLIGIFFTPLALAVILAGAVGISLFLATLQVFMRDTKFIVQFGISILYFTTPIFYPTRLIPQKFLWLTEVNPIYRLIEPFRISVYAFRWDHFQTSLAKGALTSGILLTVAILYWRHARTRLYVHL
jgi:ABC-type polysaccharide/polyol phosphate export permease